MRVLAGGTNHIYLKPQTYGVRTYFSCSYNGVPISIFAAHAHTHRWGRVNSMYRVRNGTISQVVKDNPQRPQTYYPLERPVDVRAGDFLVGQCVYDNDENRIIEIGDKDNDEMCNVYAMYSFELESLQKRKISNYVPILNCWNNQFPNLTSLIPKESDVLSVDMLEKIDSVKNEYSKYSSNTHSVESSSISTHSSYAHFDIVQEDSCNVTKTWSITKRLPMQLGEITDLALAKNDTELVIFHRASRQQPNVYFKDNNRFRNENFGAIKEHVLLHFNITNEQIVYKWGADMFYMPHSLTIDHKGNFWLTDIALHQILMFEPHNLLHPALTVGKRFEPGSGSTQFCQPTDVKVTNNGDFFVADDYCNRRIIKFDYTGQYVTEWVSSTSNVQNIDSPPWAFQSNIIHSLALNENAQLLCSVGYDHLHIQCFDLNMRKLQKEIFAVGKRDIGSIYAIEFVPNTKETILFAVTSDTILEKTIHIIDAKHGDIIGSFNVESSIYTSHGLAVSSDSKTVYLGEWNRMNYSVLYKFKICDPASGVTRMSDDRALFSSRHSNFILVIAMILVVSILVTGLIRCIIDTNKSRTLYCVHRIFYHMKRQAQATASVVDVRLNHGGKFQQLQQYSDSENELLENVRDGD